MTNVFKLFKLQIDNTFDVFKVKNVKAMLKSIVKYFLALGILTYILTSFLNRAVNIGIKVNVELMAIIILVIQVISFLFALGSIIGKIYLNRDNELLMVLPASINQIFTSKVLVLYVVEVVYNSIITLPVFISIGIYAGYPVGFYFGLIAFTFILPVLPIALALLASIPTMYVYRFFKKHFVLSIVFSIALISVAFYLYMEFISGVSGAFNITEKQVENILKINEFIVKFGRNIPLVFQLTESMISISKFPIILLHLAINSVVLAASIVLIKPFYLKVAVISRENKVDPDIKPKEYKVTSSFVALLTKEVKMVFRSPGYVFQYFMFTLLMPIIVLAYDRLLISITVNQVGQTLIMGAHILAFSVMVVMNNIASCSAISRDGGSFYIAKISPISYHKQAWAKIAFNAIFTVLAIVVTTPLVIAFVELNPWEVIVCSIIILFVGLGHIVMCFDIDLRNPILDWYDTSEITSVSKNTTKGILLGMLIPLFICFVMLYFSAYPIYIPYIILLVFSIGFCLLRGYMLYLRTNYYYKNIEM